MTFARRGGGVVHYEFRVYINPKRFNTKKAKKERKKKEKEEAKNSAALLTAAARCG